MDLPTLVKIESLEPGQSFPIIPSDWPEETLNQWLAAMHSVISEVLDRFPITLRALRAIHVAHDFPATVDAWLEHLGKRTTGSTNEAGFQAHGKTIRWTGPDGGPRAVVIISEGVGCGIIQGHSLSQGVLAHELGHAFEAAVWPTPLPSADVLKLDELFAYVAEATISEFLAETVGASFIGEEWRTNNVKSLPEWLVHQTDEVESHVERYFETDDWLTTWRESSSRLGQVFIHLGRTAAAALHHDPENDDVDRESPLLDLIGEDRPGWRSVVDELLEVLNRLDGDPASWLDRGVDDVAALYRKSWAVEGLQPYYNASGLFQLLVASPGTHPRGTRANALASASAAQFRDQ